MHLAYQFSLKLVYQFPWLTWYQLCIYFFLQSFDLHTGPMFSFLFMIVYAGIIAAILHFFFFLELLILLHYILAQWSFMTSYEVSRTDIIIFYFYRGKKQTQGSRWLAYQDHSMGFRKSSTFSVLIQRILMTFKSSILSLSILSSCVWS